MSVLFLNFLISGLRNSSANSFFDIFSFLTVHLFRVAKVSDHAGVAASPEVYFIKTFRDHWSIPRWYPSYFEFLAILKASSPNVLLEAVLSVKYLKSP